MANTSGMCTQFKTDILNGQHVFGAAAGFIRASTAADSFKAALYVTTATMGPNATAYSATGEVTNGSGTGYTATGLAFTWVTPANSGGSPTVSGATFATPSASLVWNLFTPAAAFDAVLLYNTTTGKAISVHNFGSTTLTNGTFTLTMPTNAATTAIINLS